MELMIFFIDYSFIEIDYNIEYYWNVLTLFSIADKDI